MRRNILQQLKTLSNGDLIQVNWNDASVGKSLSGGLHGIDVPVISIGVFLGVLGERNKHIILGQNHFRYADGLYDIDYTAVPASWTVQIAVIVKSYISPDDANQLVTSFLMGGRRPKRTKQQRVKNHSGL